MRLGAQVMSACLVDVSVAGRVAIATRPATDASTRRHITVQLVGQYPIIRLLHGIKMKKIVLI